MADRQDVKDRIAALKEQLSVARARERKAAEAYAAWRGEFFEMAASITPYVAVEANGAVYFASTQDSHIGKDLFVKQSRKEMRVLRRALEALDQLGALPERRVLFDVGANIGTSAIDAVVAHGFQRAVAFEPEPSNFRTLRLAIAANGLERKVVPVQAAVSDAEGTLDLEISMRGSGKHRVAGEGERQRGARIPVRALTLDGYLASGKLEADAVSLLWMDVEGHEGQVLAGASALLERRVPFVMEFSPKHFARTARFGELAELVSRHYTHVLDLQEPRSSRRLVEATDLQALLDRYEDGFTDVLVVAQAG